MTFLSHSSSHNNFRSLFNPDICSLDERGFLWELRSLIERVAYRLRDLQHLQLF